MSDTTNVARLDASNTFTGTTNTVGNANTDILAVQATMRGVGRAVSIDDDTTTAPTYATGTGELFVAGDIESGGTVYATAFNAGTGTDGSRAITMVTNTALTPAGDQIYFINDALYFSQAGAQKTPMRIEDAQTATGKKTFQGDIAVGDATNAGTIDIYDGSSNYWQLAVPSLSADYTLTLPTSAGTTGQYLKTTTTGASAVLSWDTPSASADTTGGTGGVQFNAGGVLTSDAGFVFTTATDKLSLGSSGGATTGTLDLYYTGTTYAATLTPNASMGADVTITMPSYTTTLLGTGANAFTGALTFSGAGTLTSPPITTAITPISAGGATLGTTALEWGNAYFTNSAVIYGQADQSATLTSSASLWTANNFTSTGTLSAGAGGFTVDADGDVTGKSFTVTRTAGVASYSDFFEVPANGNNYVRVKSPDSLAADYTVTLPAATGTLVIEGLATGGVILGDSTPDTAGEIEFDATDKYSFYGANSEDFYFRVGSAANNVIFGSSTGVTDISLSAINLVTTGTISGKIPMITKSDNYTLGTDNAQEAYGYMIWMSGANKTLTLPAVVAGMSGCLYSTDAEIKRLDPNASDGIRMGAARDTDGDAIASTAAIGAFVCFVADGADGWTILGKNGTWTAE